MFPSLKFGNLILLLGLCAGLFYMAQYAARIDPALPKAEKTVADFPFRDIKGANHRLSDFKRKKLIVHFWATWCAPCVKELPQLMTFMDKNPQLTLLTFSADADKEAVLRFLSTLPAKPANVIHIWDQQARIANSRFKVTGYPESFVYEKDLVLRQHIQGNVDWNGFSAF